MEGKHSMKHASKVGRKWKAVIIILSVIAGISLLFLVYLYFPIVSESINKGIKYLFTPPDGQEEQETAEGQPQEAQEIEEETEPEEPVKEEPDTGQEAEEEEDTQQPIQEDTQQEQTEQEETQQEQAEQEETIPQGTAPTISLRILEGPLYSTEDDVCYYRIIADVTGDPVPGITFSKDDSLGSLGKGKAQVNLTRDNQAFTLNATAQNSMGNASDSITLNWSCNRAPDITGITVVSDTLYIDEDYDIQVEVVDLDGDELTYLWSADGGEIDYPDLNPNEWDAPHEPGDYTISVTVTDAAGNVSEASIQVSTSEKPVEPENLDLPRKEGEGGYVEYGGDVYVGGAIYAGDSDDDLPCAGFISFDITGIAGRTVDSAKLTLTGASLSGDPMEFQDELSIHSVWWGAEPMNQGDFMKAGIIISSYDSSNITCKVSKLKQELQNAIDDGKPRFQIRIQFGPYFSDNDGEEDGWSYLQGNVNLNVTLSD